MKISNKLKEQFVNYFETGYQFEEFTKIFLQKIGFDDVKVTKKSGDKGIDLTCIKEEIDCLNLNTAEYIVQAKKYAITNKVGSKDIKEFKGVTSSARKIFITTSSFTADALLESKDKTNPVMLIDGDMIVEYCSLLTDFVFDLIPEFSKQRMDDLFNFTHSNTIPIGTIEKIITKNDVRARILRIPNEIAKVLEGYKNYSVVINKEKEYHLNISSDRKYFGGITKYYKELGFISNDNFSQAISEWRFEPENKKIYIDIK